MATYKDVKVWHLIFGVVVWLLSLLFSGFVLMTLWDWFIVPTFGLFSFTVIQASGIALVVVYVTPDSKQDNSDGFIMGVLTSALRNLIRGVLVLGAGFVFALFM